MSKPSPAASSPASGPHRSFLDHASGMPLRPAARTAMMAAYDAGYGDPRRLHHEGRSARLLLDNARAVIAECLEVRTDEVVFTTSGTEAVHRAIAGLYDPADPRPVVASAVEHAAVFAALRALGAPVVRWPVTALGAVDLDRRGDLGEVPPQLYVVQSANHEVGTRQPLDQMPGDAPLVVDACAGMGLEPLAPTAAVSAGSAHKWGGPAGVGVLVVRKHTSWRHTGPDDDRGDYREVGFPLIASALGAAAALQETVRERTSFDARARTWIDRIRREVLATIPDVDIVGDPEDRLPHVVTFSCLYVNGEALVTALDREGLAVTSGSACTSSTLTPSHVLAAMGALTHGNLRVSVGWDTTEADIDHLLATLPSVVAKLRQGVV